MSAPDKIKENTKPDNTNLPDYEKEDTTFNDHPTHSQSPDELRLERFANNLEDVDDTLDDDDDENDHIAHHPLLGMLAGRLNQRTRRGSTHRYDPLHPVTSILSVGDLEACYALELNFPEEERASREKFEYRLSQCPELCLGIFSQPTKAEAEKSGQPSKRKLVSMIIATRTRAPYVSAASMEVPQNWRANPVTLPPGDASEIKGHQDVGGTIALHALVTDPEHQRKGLADVLLRSYIQRIKDSKIAERIALLAHDNMVSFYQRFGFEDMGESTNQWAGVKWRNLILNFSDVDED